MAWKKCPNAKEVSGDGNGNDKFQTEEERLELKIKYKGEMWRRMAMMSVEREDAHSPYDHITTGFLRLLERNWQAHEYERHTSVSFRFSSLMLVDSASPLDSDVHLYVKLRNITDRYRSMYCLR
jgi:hypothetical protein